MPYIPTFTRLSRFGKFECLASVESPLLVRAFFQPLARPVNTDELACCRRKSNDDDDDCRQRLPSSSKTGSDGNDLSKATQVCEFLCMLPIEVEIDEAISCASFSMFIFHEFLRPSNEVVCSTARGLMSTRGLIAISLGDLTIAADFTPVIELMNLEEGPWERQQKRYPPYWMKQNKSKDEAKQCQTRVQSGSFSSSVRLAYCNILKLR